jgi:hypothetical protein
MRGRRRGRKTIHSLVRMILTGVAIAGAIVVYLIVLTRGAIL